jgi:hypothetical protein
MGTSWEPHGDLMGPHGTSWDLMGPHGDLMGTSWGPHGTLMSPMHAFAGEKKELTESILSCRR